MDSQGLPRAIAMTSANVADRKGRWLHLNQARGLSRGQTLRCDSGYVGRPCAQGIRHILGEHVMAQIAKHSELHTSKDAQALDFGAKFCLAGEAAETVEELPATAQHQFAVLPLGILDTSAPETLNRL